MGNGEEVGPAAAVTVGVGLAARPGSPFPQSAVTAKRERPEDIASYRTSAAVWPTILVNNGTQESVNLCNNTSPGSWPPLSNQSRPTSKTMFAKSIAPSSSPGWLI